MKIVGICCVRNAADIIGVVCAYHISIGFDRLIVIDDGSTDGTTDILDRLARKTGRIELVLSRAAIFDQTALTNGAVALALRAGANYVAPFDADEFYVFKRDPRLTLASHHPHILRVPVVNFTQSRAVDRSWPFSMLLANYRAPAIQGDARALVRGHHCAFVQAAFPSKAIAPAGADLQFAKGNHAALLSGAIEIAAPDIEILHLPLRSKRELVKRAVDYETRRAPMRMSQDDSWQSQYFRDCHERQELDCEWRANSHYRGEIDVYGKKFELIKDNRLRFCFVRAMRMLSATRLTLPGAAPW